MDSTLMGYIHEGRQVGSRYTMRARRTGRGLVGSHTGSQAGRSLEFVDHRDYQPGDDLRTMDWSAYARSQRLTVKLYQDEIRPTADIVIDGSKALALADSAKLRATVALCALLSEAASNADMVCRAWLTGSGCRRIDVSGGAADRWESLAFDSMENPEASFRRTPPAFHAKGIRVFVSDLLWLGDPMAVLQLLAHQASSVVVVQMLARADVAPQETGFFRLVDSETGQVREVQIDDGAIARYRQRLEHHQQNWHRACRQLGATLVTLTAESFVESWLLDDLVAQGVLAVA